MRKFMIAAFLSLLGGVSTSHARGGMHGGGMHAGAAMRIGGLHGMALQGLAAPANPAVPPSLTSDPRLLGTAPLPPHHQPTPAEIPSTPDALFKQTPGEAAVDRAIGNICRGC